jgi:hypothetical protein
LSPDDDFKLVLLLEDGGKRKNLVFASLIYKDIFATKTYAEARYLIESMKIFADQKYSDLSTDKFEVREKKNEKGSINHTFFCKFIADEKVYLDRAKCKTIAAFFFESIYIYPKHKLHEKVINKIDIHFAKIDDLPEQIENLLEAQIAEIFEKSIPISLKKQLHTCFLSAYSKMKDI